MTTIAPFFPRAGWPHRPVDRGRWLSAHLCFPAAAFCILSGSSKPQASDLIPFERACVPGRAFRARFRAMRHLPLQRKISHNIAVLIYSVIRQCRIQISGSVQHPRAKCGRVSTAGPEVFVGESLKFLIRVIRQNRPNIPGTRKRKMPAGQKRTATFASFGWQSSGSAFLSPRGIHLKDKTRAAKIVQKSKQQKSQQNSDTNDVNDGQAGRRAFQDLSAKQVFRLKLLPIDLG